jgi:hypothetical protein
MEVKEDEGFMAVLCDAEEEMKLKAGLIFFLYLYLKIL